MFRILLPTALISGAILLPLAGHTEPFTDLKSLKLEVPTSDRILPAGPGSDVTNNNCLACHSADHVLNQPSLSREAWQEGGNKMITAYGAPVSPEDAKAIVDYLARTKGTS